jgi:hypothetical protein
MTDKEFTKEIWKRIPAGCRFISPGETRAVSIIRSLDAWVSKYNNMVMLLDTIEAGWENQYFDDAMHGRDET